MAYARPTHNSSVYMYYGINGYTCQMCKLSPDEFGCFSCENPKDMMHHLLYHFVILKDKIPKYCMQRLQKDFKD